MRRVVAGTGKALITLGVLILLFVAYQLWGTGIYTARQQHKLENQFEQALRTAGSGSEPTYPTTATTTHPGATVAGTDNPVVTSPGSTTPTTVPVTPTTESPIDLPDTDAVARIVIPKIDVDKIVVQGVTLDDLRSGPGHYPSTPYPGQAGNAAIAGHRTTYGAPFGRLDDLEVGDVIKIRTVEGQFQYVVYDKFPVSPDDFHVLDPDPQRKATLTLTTCHPPYTAAQRLIVKAELQLPPNVEPLPSTAAPSNPEVTGGHDGLTSESLSGHSGSKLPTLLTGLLMLLVGLLWWLLFHRHPRWTTWFIGVIPFAITLSIFYFYLERALPANY